MNIAISPNTCDNIPICCVGMSSIEMAGNCNPAAESRLTIAVQNTKAFMGAVPFQFATSADRTEDCACLQAQSA